MSGRLGLRGIAVLMLAASAAGLTLTGAGVRAEDGDGSFVLPGDARSGWQLFFSRQCVECHALWGYGGTRGPDLGRFTPARLSASGLAAEMWNHVPSMHARMEEEGLVTPSLTLDEMADLFAFLYFVISLDEPGDPELGRALLQQKSCALCHSVQGVGGKVGPDLTKWGNYVNPIVWAQRMWVNAPTMERKMRARGLKWPELTGDDMIHIIAYVRSATTTGERGYLAPGSPGRGRDLFVAKSCSSCHAMRGGEGRGPDLGRVDMPRTLSQTAFLMWNHSSASTISPFVPMSTARVSLSALSRAVASAMPTVSAPTWPATIGRNFAVANREHGRSYSAGRNAAGPLTAGRNGERPRGRGSKPKNRCCMVLLPTSVQR